MTSAEESFPMVMVESKSWGIPLVTYSLPYLEILRDKQGYVEVAQNDITSAARQIVALLNDYPRCEALSAEALHSVEPFRNFDQAKAWQQIIAEVTSGQRPKIRNNIDRHLLETFLSTMLFHYRKGCESLHEKKISFSWTKMMKYYLLSKIITGKKRQHYKEKYRAQQEIRTLEEN